MTDQEKLLDKLAKIQAHADSAREIGSEAEAEAFAEMLQQLMLKHKIAMSDIQLANLEKDEPVGQHRMDYDKGGIPLKKARSHWLEQLASIVARAHFCRILVISGSNRITLVGRESDCAVAEYTLMTLARATKKLAARAQDKFYYQCQREGRLEDAKGFMASFINAFVSRLGQRFDEDRKTAEESSSTALVRVETADKAVEDYIADRFHSKASSLSRNRRFNKDGVREGRAAANRVNLHGKAVGTSTRLKLN